MNLKKSLRSKAGWSFIEYAVIFVAVTAATVIFIKEMISNKGRIQQALRFKTDTYIAKSLGAPPPLPPPPPIDVGECPQAASWQEAIDQVETLISTCEQQRAEILSNIHDLDDEIDNVEDKEDDAHDVCEACDDVCKWFDIDDACEAEDALEQAIDAMKTARADLITTYNDLGDKINEYKKQKDDLEKQMQEALIEQCPEQYGQ